jgi:hypothetical protein
VARFDHSRGTRFATFAMRHIHGAVSRALAERFATVHIPVKRVKDAGRLRRELPANANGAVDSAADHSAPRLAATRNLGEADMKLPAMTGAKDTADARLVELIRERLEAAIYTAAERVGKTGRGRGRANRGALAERLIRDRILIPEESERTSLRQIARDFDCTVGRVLGCEKRIIQIAAAGLQSDPVYMWASEMTARTGRSIDSAFDGRHTRELAAREERVFAARFSTLSAEQKASCIDRMAQDACGGATRLSLMLFRALPSWQRAHMMMRLAPPPPRARAA